ncbi:MAG: AEC family transporter, partial [Lachnospiraceae bacterium]|nr:AEC family transporter [Candidatus Equihabitans merdae]
MLSVSIILTQMGVILLFMILGFVAGKKNQISAAGTRDLSWLAVNICGPCQGLSAVVQANSLHDHATAFKVLGLNFLLYAILFVVGIFTGPLLRAEKSERKFFHVMTVFGNCGFLGLPLCEAVFGKEALLYLTMN